MTSGNPRQRRRTFDESDVRVRPSRSVPRRSKDRPDYKDLPLGFVTQVDRGRSLCLIDDGTTVTAMKARELGKNAVVVGDIVKLDGDVSGVEGSLARIVEVNERRNSLSRTIDDAGAMERAIVSNVDLMLIVVAISNPEPRTGFIDRALVVAFDQGITPILVITKCDLADASPLADLYSPLSVEVFTTKKGEDPHSLRDRLQGKTSVLIGHSGVGKSTLLNSILGHQARITGDVNEVTGRGRHTSSNAVAFKLDGNPGAADVPGAANQERSGWLIDTPGVRSFGLRHIDPDRVVGAFAELSEVIARCPKNCSHNEESCALNEWLKVNPQGEHRVANLRRLLAIDATVSYE
ncbi:MAG: ribosome small subunit-dependent GTPase A [Candidatus Nanopelagicaceae bacterium]